jgi:hypothetical protein
MVLLEAALNDFFVSWSKVQPAVARVSRVCSYDRAGLGWSDISLQPRPSEVMVRELHTLLRNTGIESPYILVGNSFGGINMGLIEKINRAFSKEKHPKEHRREGGQEHAKLHKQCRGHASQSAVQIQHQVRQPGQPKRQAQKPADVSPVHL